MKTQLKVFGIISIVLGGLAILGSASSATQEDFAYSLIGGGYVLAQGIISYIGSKHTA